MEGMSDRPLGNEDRACWGLRGDQVMRLRVWIVRADKMDRRVHNLDCW